MIEELLDYWHVATQQFVDFECIQVFFAESLSVRTVELNIVFQDIFFENMLRREDIRLCLAVSNRYDFDDPLLNFFGILIFDLAKTHDKLHEFVAI